MEVKVIVFKMKHKHKWQFAEFMRRLYQNPNRDEKIARFICECGKVKDIELK